MYKRRIVLIIPVSQINSFFSQLVWTSRVEVVSSAAKLWWVAVRSRCWSSSPSWTLLRVFGGSLRRGCRGSPRSRSPACLRGHVWSGSVTHTLEQGTCPVFCLELVSPFGFCEQTFGLISTAVLLDRHDRYQPDNQKPKTRLSLRFFLVIFSVQSLTRAFYGETLWSDYFFTKDLRITRSIPDNCRWNLHLTDRTVTYLIHWSILRL